MPQDNNERTHHHRAESARAERSRNERPSAAKEDVQYDLAHGVEEGLRVQKEMLDVLHDVGQEWFTRTTSQAEMVLKLPNRLISAHTVPDALSAYREWLGEWIGMCDEDSRRFVSDSQKIVDQGIRYFTASAPVAST